LISKTVKIPIYHGQLTVCIYENDKDIEELKLKYDISELCNYAAIYFPLHNSNGFTRYFILFSNECKYSDVVHECVHLTNGLFLDRGIILDPNNDEPQAYFTGWAFNQCIGLFKKLESRN